MKVQSPITPDILTCLPFVLLLPVAQEVTEGTFSQGPTKQIGDTSHTTPQLLSDHNTRVCSVEYYENTGKTANLYQR